MSLRLALDFGGTRLSAGLVELPAGRLLAHLEAPSPPDGDAGRAAMLELAGRLLEQAPAHTIGVSFGGPVASDGRTVRRSMQVPGWEDFPLAQFLEDRLGLPAAIANDGAAAALAEARLGAGQGFRVTLYVTVSTGIGGGLALDGQVYRGERGWAGEIGHLCALPGGPVCSCGRSGCLEALASGRAIGRAYGAGRTARQAAEAAAAGDARAADIWAQAMEHLGIGLASAANLLNPGVIVLGGGVTQAGEQFFAPVRAAFARHCLDGETRLVPAGLGQAVCLIGAALASAPPLPPEEGGASKAGATG
jgi:glucokinase